MMATGFKPVGWVAAVAGAALGCYMLSLNVAAERAELMKLERGIITAKRDIRALQTELGTRGRLSQLEHWNAEVLALSAPTSAQFLEDEVTLARFDVRQKPIGEQAATVRMASAETKPQAPAAAKAPVVIYAAAPAGARAAEPGVQASLVRRASMVIAPTQPAGPSAPAPAAKPRFDSGKPTTPAPAAKPRLDSGKLAATIAAASRTERVLPKAQVKPDRKVAAAAPPAAPVQAKTATAKPEPKPARKSEGKAAGQ